MKTQFVDTFDGGTAHQPREHANSQEAIAYAVETTKRRQCEVRVLGEYDHVDATYRDGVPVAA